LRRDLIGHFCAAQITDSSMPNAGISHRLHLFEPEGLQEFKRMIVANGNVVIHSEDSAIAKAVPACAGREHPVRHAFL